MSKGCRLGKRGGFDTEHQTSRKGLAKFRNRNKPLGNNAKRGLRRTSEKIEDKKQHGRKGQVKKSLRQPGANHSKGSTAFEKKGANVSTVTRAFEQQGRAARKGLVQSRKRDQIRSKRMRVFEKQEQIARKGMQNLKSQNPTARRRLVLEKQEQIG